jgi:hypothetical protein
MYATLNIKSLRNEARRAAEHRGHTLGKFSRLRGNAAKVYSPTWETYSAAGCKSCGADVAVYPNPAPNGIEICGEAVATNCTP